MTELSTKARMVPQRRGLRSSFARNEDGSLIIFGLLIFIIMLAAAGIGVDFMRYEAQRTRLQSTLDRAILAAASLDQPLSPQDVVLDYFNKAGLGDYITADDINVVETSTSRHVDVAMSMDVDATLLKFAGIDMLSAPAAGAAEESIYQTEISLILDVSGSMGWRSASGRSKISELKDAAGSFINIVMCDPSDPTATTNCVVAPGLVSINLVPYSEQVLVGEDLLSRFNVTMEHTASSCATFDPNDFDTTAITPQQRIKRTGQIDVWGDRNNPAGAWGWTCQPDAWREITTVEGDAAALRSAINALSAGGSTSIDLGMKWGSALLDPAIQPLIADMASEGKIDSQFSNRPRAAGTAKVIVLMTDGINTQQAYLYDNYRDGPSPVWRTNEKVVSNWSSDYRYSIYDAGRDQYYWEYDRSWHDHVYGTGGTHEETTCTEGYWTWSWWAGWHYVSGSCTTQTITEGGNGAYQMSYPELWANKNWNWWNRFDWLSNPGSHVQDYQKDQRLAAICDAAKAEGYTVFTVGFEVTAQSADVMRSCATGDAYFFNADGTNLVAAFASIARDISELRLVN